MCLFPVCIYIKHSYCTQHESIWRSYNNSTSRNLGINYKHICYWENLIHSSHLVCVLRFRLILFEFLHLKVDDASAANYGSNPHTRTLSKFSLPLNFFPYIGNNSSWFIILLMLFLQTSLMILCLTSDILG